MGGGQGERSEWTWEEVRESAVGGHGRRSGRAQWVDMGGGQGERSEWTREEVRESSVSGHVTNTYYRPVQSHRSVASCEAVHNTFGLSAANCRAVI